MLTAWLVWSIVWQVASVVGLAWAVYGLRALRASADYWRAESERERAVFRGKLATARRWVREAEDCV
jgi:hypothetical protein